MLFYLAALLGLYLLYRWYWERQTVENLTEKYVFITGCDSGFGNLLARQLDLKGMRVLAGCLTKKGAEELEKATSNHLKTTILDVTSTESVAAATEWVKGCVGDKGLWGLVNNAGIGKPVGLNALLTKEDFAKVINVNLLGLIDVTLQMLPLVKRARGRVVNVSSVLGRIAYYGGGYSPAKFGVEAFSDSLRRELHAFGVQVSIIEPGIFRTAIIDVQNHFKNTWEQLPPDIREIYGENFIKRYCKIAKVIVNLGSSNLSLVTNCIEHALKSCYPRSRYSAGLWAKSIFIPASYLPSCVVDFLTSYIFPKPSQTT
ncbi:retinol dehydrogenase 16-like [Heteronotia binoei]|uniref:retinol dehydrogenase 16-like n=1 Tax=Heteronotia binoei TaxID=13085 RepID=UPI00292FB99B|nr:retinol dehydrogenase 16-like [Heteronotia binoei]